MHHVPEKVGLPGLAELRHSDVGQHLLLQDLVRVLDPLLLGDSGPGAAAADEVQGNVLLLDHESLVQGRLDLKEDRTV